MKGRILRIYILEVAYVWNLLLECQLTVEWTLKYPSAQSLTKMLEYLLSYGQNYTKSGYEFKVASLAPQTSVGALK